MAWTYKMGRMPAEDAREKHCEEGRCPASAAAHPAVYRVEATSDNGKVRRRNLCMVAACACAERVGHQFPPGMWA